MARSSARRTAGSSVRPSASIIIGKASSERRPIIMLRMAGVISLPRRRRSSVPERLKISSVLNIRPSKSKTTALMVGAADIGSFRSKSRRLFAAVGEVEHIHGMRDPDFFAGAADGSLDLQRAPGVTCDDRVDIARKNIL